MARIHQRQAIRTAVMEQLLRRTVAMDSVVSTKKTPWRTKDLPGISVYTLTEPVDEDSRSTAPRELRRVLRVQIEGALQLTDDIADALDAFAVEIEAAVDSDPTFGGAASDAFLADTAITIEPGAEQPVGSIVLTYEVPYYTPCPHPDDVSLPNDFATADVRTNLGGTQATADQAEDRVTVPTT